MTKRILFVCMGNICRSPAAEAVLQDLADREGADIEVESAGTHGYHVGEPADERMRRSAAARGYRLTSTARRVDPKDLDGSYDLVVAMDRENQELLLRKADRDHPDHIRLFSEFLGPEWPRDVPDPYYGGIAGFDRVLDMLEAGCPEILRSLQAGTVVKNARGDRDTT